MEKLTWSELRDILNSTPDDDLTDNVVADTFEGFKYLGLLANCEGGLDSMGDGQLYFITLED